MIRKNIYKWHTWLSLVMALPVLLWALSGAMHPLMTNVKPRIATSKLEAVPVDPQQLGMSLPGLLRVHGLDTVHQVRFVHIDTIWFWQVQRQAREVPRYFSTRTGKELRRGDELYAQYLAKQFLEGQDLQGGDLQGGDLPGKDLQGKDLQGPGQALQTVARSEGGHDCCDAATDCVLLNEKGAQVSSVKRVTDFDEAYRSINRLLPVYRVGFDREDGVRLYIETTSDRLAFVVDNRRAMFDQIFSWFHNWSWMDAMGNGKYLAMILILTVAMISTIMGMYIFAITKTKKSNGHSLLKARRNHRWTAIPVSFVMLMFCFSGAYHAWKKMEQDDRQHYFVQQRIPAEKLELDWSKLQQLVQQPVHNIGIAEVDGQYYWQAYTKKKMHYVHNSLYTVDKSGEAAHAQYLANMFGRQQRVNMMTTTPVFKFAGEYGFVNKRLPVWKVQYRNNDRERFYVETSSGVLSVRVDDGDLAEGYSFAMMHKHHFMDWGGKALRDASTLIWAMLIAMATVVGLVLWRIKVKRVG